MFHFDVAENETVSIDAQTQFLDDVHKLQGQTPPLKSFLIVNQKYALLVVLNIVPQTSGPNSTIKTILNCQPNICFVSGTK
jgi:hypothetical protein